MSEHDRWMIVPSLADVMPFESVDLSPYVEACDDAVRDLVYRYDPQPDRLPFKEGATPGWVVIRLTETGPARVVPVVALADGEGGVVIEQTGEWQDTTVVDREDRP